MSINSTSPQSLFGGTWEQIKDKFLLSSGDTYSAGSTGGEASHTLTIGEMPSHYHAIWTTDSWSYDAVGLRHSSKPYGVAGVNASGGTEQWADFETGDGHQIIREAGDGGAHNNMPPYLVVYMWKRIS